MGNEYIPKILKEYRKKNHFTVKDVSLMLHEYSIDVAPKTIYGWENGESNPSADILLTLCVIYNITDVLTTFQYIDNIEYFHVTASERTLVEAYRKHPEMHRAIHKLLNLKVVRKKKGNDMSK